MLRSGTMQHLYFLKVTWTHNLKMEQICSVMFCKSSFCPAI